ncbi:WXG100 family type VII secretion target [Streptomyces violaceorubidus]|uniref:WXG100 family type VII secretion target n=1 Tax=Streptomyces violaceorubidus TaxID=284042 RepID=UPI0004C29040|nr:WXG100 family type VII secretion target [Streptomyces violaceorubidus]
MAGDLRAADSQATRNGITALEAAKQGITRSRQDVEATKANLATGYQGSDGHAFTQLVAQWEGQCDIILKSLEEMIDALNTNDQEVNKNQQQANDAIRNASQKTGAAFSALMGA